jgi:DNA-binding CsgD family transcriptional regulator
MTADSGRDRQLLMLVAGLGLALAVDVVADLLAMGEVIHVAVEILMALLIIRTLIILMRASMAERRTRRRLEHAVARLDDEVSVLRRHEAELHATVVELRASASEAASGLAQIVDRTFAAWGLSPVEAQVGFLLLKGFSTKEIAGIRGTSERTVRDQAQAVYRKAGLAGRAELAAWFLEDLLPGTSAGADQSAGDTTTSA